MAIYKTPAHSKQPPQPLPPIALKQPPVSPDTDLGFMWSTFTNLNEWVRFSDAKAAAVLAADGAMVGAIATWLAGSHVGPVNHPVAVVWLISVVMSAFYSASYALSSLTPKLKTGENSSSLIFFADIERHFPTSAEFTAKIRKELADPDRAVTEIAQQVWANSKIATLKYARVAQAIYGLSLAVYMGFAGVVVLAVIRLTKGF